MPTPQKILLAVTGGIAAYKSAELCRNLIKAGFDLRVVMTEGATAFINPLTFQALSGEPVHTELLDPEAEAGMGHIELAKWPDLILVAPATANFIARYASGMASDLLSTLLIATEAKVALAPAMNQAMWKNPLTQNNLNTLESLLGENLIIWGPDAGQQACGDIGPGRMLEPEDICQRVQKMFSANLNPTLDGRKVLITAGPTRESIDPVRYISNHSSGKMGYALAEAAKQAGADVTLVTGPTQIEKPCGIKTIEVLSADEMLEAVQNACPEAHDIFIATAAVADYKVLNSSQQKMKKQGDGGVTLELTQNPDILATISSQYTKLFTVGFAAETQNVKNYARDKLHRKQLDLIIANDVSRSDIGFNSDQNAVSVLGKEFEQDLPLAPKRILADHLISIISKQFLDQETQ